MQSLKDIAKFTDTLGDTGVFVTAGSSPNTMTASWGGAGVMWNRAIIAVPIRNTRFTFGKIEETGEFSVSIPKSGEMKELLTYFGTKSGRDVDKYLATGTKLQKCREIGTSVLADCETFYECRVLYRSDIKPEHLPEGFITAYYPHHDYHTVFYGEIVAAYRK